MAPVITIIRHAEGLHNLYLDYSIIDPKLTDTGLRQCSFVCKDFPRHAQVTHILASPLLRTVQTAYYCFTPAIDRGVKITAMQEVTEKDADGCNRGQAPEQIITSARSTFGSDVLDEQSFRSLPPNWFEKSGLYADTPSTLRQRALVARQAIQRLASTAGDDAHIVVVSHGQFLRYLVGSGPGWGNAEWRSYTIGADSNATLTQINGPA